MSDSDFRVRNGLVVNSGAFSANLTHLNATGNIAVTGTSHTIAGNVAIGNNLTTVTSVFVGNSTSNVVINSTAIIIAGTPFTSNGFAPGGSNTFIQFNDMGVFAGNAAFTFDKATTTVAVGNATVNVYINSTTFSGSANNSNYLGGVAASGYANTSNPLFSANVSIGNATSTAARITIGNATVNTFINSTFYTGSANNSNYLGGLAAANYANTSAPTFTTSIKVGNATSNVTISQPSMLLQGNTTSNTVVNTIGVFIKANAVYTNTSLSGNTLILGGADIIGNTTALDLGNNIIGNFLSVPTVLSANYVVAGTDTGLILEVNSAANVYITLPNSLTKGFNIAVVQVGTGNVVMSNAAGATLRKRSAGSNCAAQWAIASMYVRNNGTGTAAEWVLGGDTA